MVTPVSFPTKPRIGYTGTDTLYKPIPARPWPLLNVSITRRIQSLAVTCSFPFSTFPVIGY